MAEEKERPAWLRVALIIQGTILVLFGILMLLEFFAGSSSLSVDYTAFLNFFAVVLFVVLPLALGAFLISNGVRKTVSKPPPLESVLTAIAALVLVFSAILTIYAAIRNLADGMRVALDVVLIVLSLAGFALSAFMARGLMRKVK
ncbi:MAG: hypothetical protein ACYC5F_08560 [Thermoleophilia bacterium]